MFRKTVLNENINISTPIHGFTSKNDILEHGVHNNLNES